jgi:DNA-binding GntR family transcriptional regulator
MMGEQGDRIASKRPDDRDFDEAYRHVRADLAGNLRDLLLFDLATQTGFKMTDLLQLKVKDLEGLKIGDRLPIANPMSLRRSNPVASETILQTFRQYLAETGAIGDDCLFRSRKGSNPLHISTVSRLVKHWLENANIDAVYGARYLRKIWEQCFQRTLEEKDATQNLKPLKPATIQEQVYDELFQAIVSGQLPPGERLDIRKIAGHMNISQNPVREALSRLEGAGFVTRQARKGIIVNELSRKNLRDFFKVKFILESSAIEAAARQRTEASIERLNEIHESFLQTDKDVNEFLAINWDFHFTIYRQARNPVLVQLITWVWNRISPYRYSWISNPKSFSHENFIVTHQGILDGMKRGDPEEVLRWLKADLDFALVDFEQAIPMVAEHRNKGNFYNKRDPLHEKAD